MPRKTDTQNPADWFLFIDSDLVGITLCVEHEVSFVMCRSKLAEVLEKLMKAELVRIGWFLVKTHDLEILLGELRVRSSDLVSTLEPLTQQLSEAYFTSRYVGFDQDDPDWPVLREQLSAITALAATIRSRLP